MSVQRAPRVWLLGSISEAFWEPEPLCYSSASRSPPGRPLKLQTQRPKPRAKTPSCGPPGSRGCCCFCHATAGRRPPDPGGQWEVLVTPKNHRHISVAIDRLNVQGVCVCVCVCVCVQCKRLQIRSNLLCCCYVSRTCLKHVCGNSAQILCGPKV